MDAKVRVHGHFNGLKTTLLFALMWAIIMLIWWATGGSRQTLSIYIVIGLITTFGTYWFSDKLAIASMGAHAVTEQEAPALYRIVRELGSLAAAAGGLDAVVFTGGIGEHNPGLRSNICKQASWQGISLNEEANKSGEHRISAADSAVDVFVIPTNEEWMIARHTQALLNL